MANHFGELPLRPMPIDYPSTLGEFAIAARTSKSVVLPAKNAKGRLMAFNLAKAFQTPDYPNIAPEELFCEVIKVQSHDDINMTTLAPSSAENHLIIVYDGEREVGWTTVNDCLVTTISSYPTSIEQVIIRNQHIFLNASESVYTAHKALFDKQRQMAIILDDKQQITGAMTDKDISMCIERGCDIWNITAGEEAKQVCIIKERLLSDPAAESDESILEGRIIITTDDKGKVSGTIPEEKTLAPLKRRSSNDGENANSKLATPSETLILGTVLNTSLRTGIVGTDEYLNIIYFNEAISDFIEAPDQLRLGGEIWQVTKSCGISRNSFTSYLESARSNKEQVIVNWVNIKDAKRYIQCRLTKVDSQEHTAGFVLSIQDITAQRNAEDAIRKLAYQDKLTQLPNRLLFDERLDLEVKRARRHGTKFAIMMLDLDGFKQVNDEYGHTAGDKLLCTVSKRLKQTIRETDTVARFGGDEFIFILPDITDDTDVALIATKMRSVIRKRCCIGEKDVEIDASIGFSIYPDDAESIKELLDLADARMYKDKRKAV